MEPLTISEDHWLEGVTRMPIDGGNEMETRRFLILHNTCGWSGLSSIEGWLEKDDGVCAHIVIERDGTIYQCRPFNRTCGHAGESAWVDPNTGVRYEGLNSCTIGIELANSADMLRDPDVYPEYNMGDLAGQPIPRITGVHKNGGGESEWETYTPAQVAACIAVSRAVVTRYNLDDLVGHEDVAPDRKVDVGPAFDMTAVRQACGFDQEIAKL